MENPETDSLEAMREQVQQLQEQLRNQASLHAEAFRRSSRRSLDNIRRRMWALGALCVLVTLLMPRVLYNLVGNNWAFLIFSTFLFALITVFHFYVLSLLPHAEDLCSDVVRFTVKISRFIRMQSLRLVVGLVMLTVWIVWYFLALPQDDQYGAVLLGGGIGLLIGLALGLRQYHLIVSRARAVQEAVRDLQHPRP